MNALSAAPTACRTASCAATARSSQARAAPTPGNACASTPTPTACAWPRCWATISATREALAKTRSKASPNATCARIPRRDPRCATSVPPSPTGSKRRPTRRPAARARALRMAAGRGVRRGGRDARARCRRRRRARAGVPGRGCGCACTRRRGCSTARGSRRRGRACMHRRRCAARWLLWRDADGDVQWRRLEDDEAEAPVWWRRTPTSAPFANCFAARHGDAGLLRAASLLSAGSPTACLAAADSPHRLRTPSCNAAPPMPDPPCVACDRCHRTPRGPGRMAAAPGRRGDAHRMARPAAAAPGVRLFLAGNRLGQAAQPRFLHPALRRMGHSVAASVRDLVRRDRPGRRRAADARPGHAASGDPDDRQHAGRARRGGAAGHFHLDEFVELDEVLYVAVLFWLLLAGPGKASLDHLVARARSPGPGNTEHPAAVARARREFPAR